VFGTLAFAFASPRQPVDSSGSTCEAALPPPAAQPNAPEIGKFCPVCFCDLLFAFVRQMSPPLHIHIIPSAAEAAQRAVSPVVVVSDPLSVASHEVPLRADSAATAPPSSLRIRSDELKRSASSPQVRTLFNSDDTKITWGFIGNVVATSFRI
jgi:hypothetical protein